MPTLWTSQPERVSFYDPVIQLNCRMEYALMVTQETTIDAVALDCPLESG